MTTTETLNTSGSDDPTTATVSWPNLGLMGKAGSGKSTIAALLNEFVDYEPMSLAGPLKDIAAQLWGDEARTDRGKLQKLGVAVRDIEEDTWVDLLVRKASKYNKEYGTPIVVDDVRFPNEYWKLKEAGFYIVEVRADRHTRIQRLQANGKWQSEEQLEHISETALDDGQKFPSDFVIGNFDTKGFLAEAVVGLLNRIRTKTEAW